MAAFVACFLAVLIPAVSFAATDTYPVTPVSPAVRTAPTSVSKFDDPEAEIPKKPNAPKPLALRPPQDVFTCERYFTYRGRTLNCDSYVRPDGEGIRPILSVVPEATAELDIYQENRLKIRSSAYLISGGLLLALAGVIVGGQLDKPEGIPIRNVAALLGVGVAASTFIYNFGLIRTNEAHLGQAVQIYNAKHPSAPIELQFSTGIQF